MDFSVDDFPILTLHLRKLEDVPIHILNPFRPFCILDISKDVLCHSGVCDRLHILIKSRRYILNASLSDHVFQVFDSI